MNRLRLRGTFLVYERADIQELLTTLITSLLRLELSVEKSDLMTTKPYSLSHAVLEQGRATD